MFPAIDALYEISPDWEPLEALDARSLHYVGQTEVAAGMLDRLIATYPESILANAVMIDILHHEGNDQQALELDKQAAPAITHTALAQRASPWLIRPRLARS